VREKSAASVDVVEQLRGANAGVLDVCESMPMNELGHTFGWNARATLVVDGHCSGSP